jgi:hypothetical protein
LNTPQEGSTLHLLSVPARVEGPAYSLVPLPGVTPLTSLDRRAHWDRNQAGGKDLAQQIIAALADARLEQWLSEHNLPPVDPLRMRYKRAIITECIRMADLLVRVDDLLHRQSTARLVYHGPSGWRVATLQSLCAARGIDFEWRNTQILREKIKAWLGAAKRYGADLGDLRRNRRLPKDSYDYLILARTNRFSLGLFPIIERLSGKARIIEERSDPAGWHIPHEVWRLEGGRPALRPGSTRIEAALRTRIQEATRTASPVLWRDVTLNEAAGQLVSDAMEGIVAHIQSLRAVLEAHPEALLVTTPVGEQHIEVARAMQRKVAVVQTCGIWEYENNLPGSGHYLLMADADADYLIERGVQREHITICGHPYYDQLIDMDAATEALQVRERLGLSTSQPLILLIGSHSLPGLLEPETLEDLFKELVQGLAKVTENGDALVLVKPHPVNRRGALFLRLAETAGLPDERLRISDEPSITPLIAACDLVVMMNSTSALEAFLFDKPVINISYTETDLFDYTATGAVWQVRTAAEVQAAVAALLHDRAAQRTLREGRARFCTRHLHAQDGGAAERAAEVLHTLAGVNNAGA